MASINEKLNYINETKSLIKDKLNDLGSEIEDETTFRDYAEKIEDLYDEWPKIDDEGTVITLNNTKKGKMNLQLKGNTNQFTTTGKQIFNKNLAPVTSDNASVSVLDTGIKMTISDTSGKVKIKIGGSELLGKTLTLKGTLSTNSTNTIKVYIAYVTNNGSNIVSASSHGLSETGVNSFTLRSEMPSGATQIVLVFSSTEGQAGDYAEFKDFFLVEGSYTEETIPNYEPYTGGIASPNPDYPQNIQIVTGENTITISNEDNTQSQTFNIDLGDLELCKIETNIDELIKQNNGKWYIKKSIGKVVLDGSEGWAKGSASTTDYSIFQTAAAVISNNINTSDLYSNNFTNIGFTGPTTTYDYDNIGLNNSSKSLIRIWIAVNRLSTNNTTGFKSWLNTHNTIVYYVLDTPIYELLNNTLQTQLNNIEQALSYNTQTNISQENNNLPFIINATALMKNSD